MKDFYSELTLPELGDCLIEFSSSFDYNEGQWDDAEPLTITLADEPDDQPYFSDLDQASQAMIRERVQYLLDEARPSHEEIAAERREAHREYRGESDRDMDLL